MCRRSLAAALLSMLAIAVPVRGQFVFERLFDVRSDGFTCAQCGPRTILVHALTDETTDHPQSAIASASVGFSTQALLASTSQCVTALDSKTPIGPPMGDNYNWDYELWGTVTGKSPDYVVRAVLVTARDHEHVAEGTSRFADASQAVTAGMFAVLNLGGTSGGSTALDSILNAYEEAHRNSQRPAWNGTFKVDLRNEVDAREKQTVRFELRDCDDKAVEKADVEIRYSGEGSVSKTTVVTDGEGAGTFDYTAPPNSGSDSITLYLGYRRPSGRLAQATSTEPITVGAEYRLEMDSTMRWTGTKDGITGMFRVTATVPLAKREIVTNTWSLEGTGTTKYVGSNWTTSDADCSATASGSGAPLQAILTYSPKVAGGTELRMTLSQTSEVFTVTCKGVSGSGPNKLWSATFLKAHESEWVDTAPNAPVFLMKGWTVSPEGSETIATKTYTQSVADGDVSAQESTTFRITKISDPAKGTSRKRSVRH